MRTIPATFDTKEEAETAIRRLEAIGVAPDRILLKELEDSGGASQPDPAQKALGRPAATRAFFVTAKVSPEQIGAATEILKGSRTEDKASALPPDPGAGSSASPASPPLATPGESAGARNGTAAKIASGEIHQTGTGSTPAGQPLPADTSGRRPHEALGGPAPQPQPRRSDRSKADWRRWAQYGIIYCLLMVAAFTGGWLLGSVF
ncbi:MAG: hypothetical protein M3Q08_18270 [Pseudomonadota bacterium]|nr:hypothetical protein [Pseudomonadota bacterium]